MRKKFVILIIVLSVIILGFIVGLAIPKFGGGCTEMGCSCIRINGERSCNTCTWSDPIFITGILNIVQQCGAQEIITCVNDVEISKRADIENKDCKTNWYFFWLNIN